MVFEVLPAPLEELIGVDLKSQRDPGQGGAALEGEFNDLALELGGEPAPAGYTDRDDSGG